MRMIKVKILGQRYNKLDNFGGMKICEICGRSFYPRRRFQMPVDTICSICRASKKEE